jgi:hypothetical protein
MDAKQVRLVRLLLELLTYETDKIDNVAEDLKAYQKKDG